MLLRYQKYSIFSGEINVIVILQQFGFKALKTGNLKKWNLAENTNPLSSPPPTQNICNGQILMIALNLFLLGKRYYICLDILLEEPVI